MLENTLELLKVISPLLAAVIAGGFAVLLNEHKKSKTKLLQAYKDIYFLQRIESIHNGMSITRDGKDNKVMVRKVARGEVPYVFSGVTPSAVERKINRLN